MLVSKKFRRNFANFGNFGVGRNFCKNKIKNPAWMLRTSLRSLYLFTIMSAKDGTGLNTVQLVTTMSIASGLTHVLANRSSMDEKTTCSASSRASLSVLDGGM